MHSETSAPTPSGRDPRAAKDYYDQLARTYEEQDDFWQNPYDTEVWRLEHELLRGHLVPNQPVLDLGCGFYPHDDFPAGTPILAADLSLESLKIADRFFPSDRKLIRLQCDALRLPLVTGSIHHIIAGGELLNHLHYQTAIREIARVLRPGGMFLFEFGAKWCLDSLWALVDATLGGPIGYGMRRKEARSFFSKATDPWVTWDITPSGSLQVQLIRARAMLATVAANGFTIEKVVSTNALSGLIPLPLQQESESRLLRALSSALIRCDRVVGRLYPVNLFAGNVFVLCRRSQ